MCKPWPAQKQEYPICMRPLRIAARSSAVDVTGGSESLTSARARNISKHCAGLTIVRGRMQTMIAVPPHCAGLQLPKPKPSCRRDWSMQRQVYCPVRRSRRSRECKRLQAWSTGRDTDVSGLNPSSLLTSRVPTLVRLRLACQKYLHSTVKAKMAS